MTNTWHDAIVEAVTDAWDFWLSQHDITVPRCIGDAVHDVMKEWLAEHKDEIIAAVAAATAHGRNLW